MLNIALFVLGNAMLKAEIALLTFNIALPKVGSAMFVFSIAILEVSNAMLKAGGAMLKTSIALLKVSSAILKAGNAIPKVGNAMLKTSIALPERKLVIFAAKLKCHLTNELFRLIIFGITRTSADIFCLREISIIRSCLRSCLVFPRRRFIF